MSSSLLYRQEINQLLARNCVARFYHSTRSVTSFRSLWTSRVTQNANFSNQMITWKESLAWVWRMGGFATTVRWVAIEKSVKSDWKFDGKCKRPLASRVPLLLLLEYIWHKKHSKNGTGKEPYNQMLAVYSFIGIYCSEVCWRLIVAGDR